MEIKQEITNIVDTLPNEVLDDLLIYLKKVQKASEKKITLSLNLNTILIEDKEVLEKLAK